MRIKEGVDAGTAKSSRTVGGERDRVQGLRDVTRIEGVLHVTRILGVLNVTLLSHVRDVPVLTQVVVLRIHDEAHIACVDGAVWCGGVGIVTLKHGG